MLRLPALRLLGFAGSCSLAVAAWLGGALPSADLQATPLSVATGDNGLLILLGWLLGTAAHGYAWWAARDRALTLRWVLGTIVLWMLPMLVVPPIGSRDVYSYACQGELFGAGISPYRHGVSSLPCTWLDTISPIWRDTTAPYGPLFVVLAGAVVWLGGSLVVIVALFRGLAVAGMLLAGACLPVLARRCGVPPTRALWVGLAGPLIGAHMIAAAHNDAVMVGLVVAGLAVAVAAARTPALALAAGALLGLAVAVKATALLALPFAALVAASGLTRRRMPLAMAAVGGSAVLAMGAVTVASGLGLGWLAGLRQTDDLIQFTSPPTAVGMTLTYLGQLFSPGFDAVPAVRLLALALLAAVLIVLWARALRASDMLAAALRATGMAFAAALLLGPVFQPWYAVVPLLLLAATTTRTRMIMAVTLAGVLSILPDGGGLPRFVKFPGAPLMTVGIVVVAWLLLRRRQAEAPVPAPTYRSSVTG